LSSEIGESVLQACTRVHIWTGIAARFVVGYRLGYRLHHEPARPVRSTIYARLRIPAREPSRDFRGSPGTSSNVQPTAEKTWFFRLLSRPRMLPGRPQTSTCSHNFLGVRFGYPRSRTPHSRFAANYEVCAMAAVCTARAIRIWVWDSNSRRARLLLLLFARFFHHRWLPHAQGEE
jgi:hypothetical protein